MANVLSGSDLTYRGVVQLPAIREASYSNGAFTGRNVHGSPQFLLAGDWSILGDPIYEVDYPGVGKRASLIRLWGDVYGGKRQTPNQPVTRGLLCQGDVLWWAYGDFYNVAGEHMPSIGATTLHADGSVSPFGPWRTTLHSQKTRGYLVEIPSDFAALHTNGQRIGSGAPNTSGNRNSPFGSELSALQTFDPTTHPPDSQTDSNAKSVSCQVLLDHELVFDDKLNLIADHSQRMPPGAKARVCNWNKIYDNGAGGVVTDMVTFGTGGTGQEILSAAAWIQTATRQGICFFGQITDVVPGYDYAGDDHAHEWYGPSGHGCWHGQREHYGQGTGGKSSTQVPYLFIYDPDKVIAAQATPWTVEPDFSIRLDVLTGGAIAAPVNGDYHFGGAWFDAVTGLLFVSEVGMDSSNGLAFAPIIHVFQVGEGGAPIPDPPPIIIVTPPVVIPPVVVPPPVPPDNGAVLMLIDDAIGTAQDLVSKLQTLRMQIAGGTVPPVVVPPVPPTPSAGAILPGDGQSLTASIDGSVFTITAAKELRQNGQPVSDHGLEVATRAGIEQAKSVNGVIYIKGVPPGWTVKYDGANGYPAVVWPG